MIAVMSIFVAIILIAMTIYLLYIKWLRSKYPPGPWPLPLIGNLHLLSQNLHIDLQRLSQTYGPVFTVWMGAQPNVIVCDFDLAMESCNKRGLEFAGRAMDSPGFYTIFNGNEDLNSRSYDEKVDIMRKIALSVMKPKGTGDFSIETIIQEEIKNMLKIVHNMKDTLLDPKLVIDVPVTNTIMRLVLNFRYDSDKDPEYLQWIKMNETMYVAFEKAVVLSFAPWLWHVQPGVRSLLKQVVSDYDDFIERYLKEHEATYQKERIRDLADLILKARLELESTDSTSPNLTRRNAAELLKDMLGAGTHTIMVTLRWAFLILARRPEVQSRIHEEIESCLKEAHETSAAGNMEQDMAEKYETLDNDPCEGSPGINICLSDRSQLPYLNAFIHETMRRCTAAPLGVPHKTMNRTHIGSFEIPQSTAVTFNIYSYHNDKKVWERPREFRPERFLDQEGNVDSAKARLLIPFGTGPRNCVGENLARIQIFLCLANVLCHFKIRCPAHQKLPTLDDGLYGLVWSPHRFEIEFTPWRDSFSE